MRMPRPYPLLVLAFVMVAALTTTLPAAAITVPEVIGLLKAGVGERVILAQLAQERATGPRPALTAREILQLKQAGASDDLMEALMSPSGPSGPTKGGLRVYRETGPEGEEILHVTNLDEAGRRIGGELPPQPPARITQATAGTQTPAGRDEGAGRETPIIVNVYPPSAERSDGSEGGYEESDLIRRAGIYPGYLGLPGTGFCNRCPAPGHGHRRPARFDDGGLFSRPSAIDTRPFRARTAAERNRTRFGN